MTTILMCPMKMATVMKFMAKVTVTAMPLKRLTPMTIDDDIYVGNNDDSDDNDSYRSGDASMNYEDIEMVYIDEEEMQMILNNDPGFTHLQPATWYWQL
jgi:hypothetical protein